MRRSDSLGLESMPLLAAAAILMALLLKHQGKHLLRLPLVRNFIFMMSVWLIHRRVDAVHRPYVSDVGEADASLMSLGGIPFEVDLGKPAKTDHYALPLLRKLFQPKNNFGLVVSMVEAHECAGDGIRLFGFERRPVQPPVWLQHDIDYINVPVQDFTADFDVAQTLVALAKMNEVLEKGKRVYVHCQAGEGRGFTMAMCYLVTYGLPLRNEHGKVRHQPLSYAKALATIKVNRPHVAASPARRALMQKVADVWHHERDDASLPMRVS